MAVAGMIGKCFMNHWRKTILFAFIVIFPAVVVGVSNFHVFPDSALSATIMLLITVGVAGVFTWQSGSSTARVSRYCVLADVVICAILCVNMGGHWLLAREVSAARQSVSERRAEEDREERRRAAEAERRIALKKAEVEAARADAERAKAAAIAINAERRRLKALPPSQRRSRSPVTAPTAQSGAQPTAEPSPFAIQPLPGGPADSAAPSESRPKITPEQVRERWWWFLTALAFAECFASVLAGAVLCAVWEWNRNKAPVAADIGGRNDVEGGRGRGGQSTCRSDRAERAQSSDCRGSMKERLSERVTSAGRDPGEQGALFERGSKNGAVGEQTDNGRGSKNGAVGEQITGPRTSNGHTAQLATNGIANALILRGDGGADWQSTSGSRNLGEQESMQWLKAAMPKAASGWWDVSLRGKGFAVKFCWRDRGLQKLTFPRITLEEFQVLKHGAAGEVEEMLRARITSHLRSLSSDPVKRSKAVVAAEKLGIALSAGLFRAQRAHL